MLDEIYIPREGQVLLCREDGFLYYVDISSLREGKSGLVGGFIGINLETSHSRAFFPKYYTFEKIEGITVGNYVEEGDLEKSLDSGIDTPISGAMIRNE